MSYSILLSDSLKGDLIMFKKLNFDTYYHSPLWRCLPEVHYSKTMRKKVEPYLKKRLTTYKICRNEDQPIYCESYRSDNPKGIVIISHGFTEFCERYHENIYYFLKAGYHVYMPEHQGHGRSFRPYLDIENPDYSLTHTDSFQEYVDDLHFIITSLVMPVRQGIPLYLYAHSMGGCIGTLYLEQHPNIFKRAILNAPMLELKLDPLPNDVAWGVAKFMCKIGKSHDYALTQYPFNPNPNFDNALSTSKARYHYVFSLTKKDKRFTNSGASYGWLLAAMRATHKALKKENCEKITTPILLFSAGKDSLVKKEGQLKLLEHVKHGTFVWVPSEKHEIFLGETFVLEKYWGIIFDFWNR